MVQRIKTGMIADGAVTTLKMNDEVENLFSFRNRIINGAMNVWQRGTSINGASSNFTADMFRHEPRNNTTINCARSTDVPSGEGFSYSMRTSATNSTDDGFHYRTYVELPGTGLYGEFQPGTTWTLSFWMKSAYSNRTIAARIALTSTSIGGSDQSVAVSPTQGTQTITTSWQRYVFNFTLPTWTAESGSLSNVTNLNIRLLQGSDDTAQDTYITGVQFERGNVATPFEFRPISTELALCQRYFQTYSMPLQMNRSHGFDNDNYRDMKVQLLPVLMRATPTFTRTASSTFGDAGNENPNGATVSVSGDATKIFARLLYTSQPSAGSVHNFNYTATISAEL
jgi:hypothetical protein